MYVPLRTAAQHYGVSKQTISIWADNGNIEFTTLPSGQRRFRVRGAGNTDAATAEDQNTKTKIKICYCRVSSHGQKDDLARQIEYMRAKYPGSEVYSDIGSGLNWKRNGLKAVLRRSLQGDVEQVAVAHRDRLARFGFEILEYILGQCGVKLLCDHEPVHRSKESELVDDILSIVTVFSARIHGQRHYTARKTSDIEPDAGGAPETEAMAGVLSCDV
jgi:predicted site-specific integrase-resolvase